MDAHLAKPIRQRLLGQVIRNVLDRPTGAPFSSVPAGLAQTAAPPDTVNGSNSNN
jgi:hypothetical protein